MIYIKQKSSISQYQMKAESTLWKYILQLGKTSAAEKLDVID